VQPRRVRIRFCVNNPRSIAEREDLIARGFECRSCLGHCARCVETRYLEADGSRVEGASYGDILRAIENRSET